MLLLLFYYGLIGLLLSIIINILTWLAYKPPLTTMEVLACILLWPTVIAVFINLENGVEQEFEEE